MYRNLNNFDAQRTESRRDLDMNSSSYYHGRNLSKSDDSFFQKSVPTGKSQSKPMPEARNIAGIISTESSKKKIENQSYQSESLSSKKRNQPINNSEGKDSTRGLEYIRPIEILPTYSTQNLDNRHYYMMSMIHEEDQPDPLHPLNTTEMINLQKTTNDHILDFRKKDRRNSQFNRDGSKMSSPEADNLYPPQINRLDAFNKKLDESPSKYEDHEIRTDKSDYDQSVSLRKNRFSNLASNNIQIKTASIDGLGHDNFSNAYGIDQKSEGYLEYPSCPSLENRASSELNLNVNNQLHHKKSFTELSMKDRYDAGAARGMYPFVSNNFSYQNRQDNQRTPMFTGGSVGQPYFFNSRVPPLSFEQIDEKREIEHIETPTGRFSKVVLCDELIIEYKPMTENVQLNMQNSIHFR